ncbi:MULTISPECIES: SufS family cysteine desulfurase [Cryobacterium]|uniref:Cysteine desulfurase n=1 Tax=Cryobacterium glucosi TaxID=1259175 RepID=A0ABY2IP47_9MICO|nr:MULTISPECIES: SufS family cysteine desulfurase [Cryobacterium]MDY7527457.1 SufS family cysteine desulfurase [Cryobacterium sp. 10C2]MDY7556756.1 SufS family cysteine desulfurase [Cryobacterium sp. 10C3]MEB0003677.1 SufS family cysteine desulfurase [Cryobacterium sp. RTC2.1]MEB0203040.1 SufS family cysteine desulfurase [Cryobacterium sp. 5I3]MEB0288317.1 SufS family cysteine desulfurase [Cryobacterium sp. 10S3]
MTLSAPSFRRAAAVALTEDEVARIRNDFPILEQRINGHPLNYLDSGATSQNPISVMEAEQEYYEQRNAAVHRGAHTLAFAATEVFESARETVAAFIGAQPDELVWTSNATEGVNLVAYAISNASLGLGGPDAARFRIGAGDEIVVTEMEHHANLIPWQQLALRTGATLRFIPVLDDGTLDLAAAATIVGPRTRLLAFTHASNVVGTINPVAELVELAHRFGALVLLDACQTVPHLPVDVAALDVDFAVFSGHKMLGPTGIGALFGKAELLAGLPPFLTGGSMITTVDMEHAEFLAPPQRFEAGTQRISQAIALAAAVDYLTETGMDRIALREAELGQRLVAGLAEIPGVRVLGPAAGIDRIGLAAFDVAGVHAHDVGQFLDEAGIAVRVGHHCAQPLHRRLGITASTRASTYLYTTTDEVDQFLAAMHEVAPFFGVKP